MSGGVLSCHRLIDGDYLITTALESNCIMCQPERDSLVNLRQRWPRNMCLGKNNESL